ncbi:hypothetical protein [Mycobacterium sp. SMC-4]|uniref:hypothetical protein n=1 Tax=Mycobacterium sp. SMC-4 TaxID=2857059 RepID=UPI003CFC75F8
MTSAQNTPPTLDEVEVSIFGPGKGESIAVHTGEGDWIIVDSCIDQQTKQIPVLDYLIGIGVDVSTSVRLVIGTHAHDDHIAGLAQVFAACSSATFVCSSALTREEFFAEIEADADIEKMFRKSIRSEYRKIFEVIEERGRQSGGIPYLKRGYEQRILWSRALSESSIEAAVTALSPSDEAVSRSIRYLSTGLAKVGDRRRLKQQDPNELAVAIAVNVGTTAVILGADLLSGPNGCGWTAVLATHDPHSLASVFKIPHHGAPNAHHDDVWSQLLTSEVISLIAPYRAGRQQRPSTTDIARIKSMSKEVYCSAKPQIALNKSAKRARTSLQGLGQNVRTWGISGQVRARKSVNADRWDVETFAPALRL